MKSVISLTSEIERKDNRELKRSLDSYQQAERKKREIKGEMEKLLTALQSESQEEEKRSREVISENREKLAQLTEM